MFMFIRDKFFIGGRWIAPSGKETIEVHNAGNGQVMGRIPAGGNPAHHLAVAGIVHFDRFLAGGSDPATADEKFVTNEHEHPWLRRRRREGTLLYRGCRSAATR